MLSNGVGTTFTTNPEQIEVIELKGYGRRTCAGRMNMQPRHVDRRKCCQQVRPSERFVDNIFDLPCVPYKLAYSNDAAVQLTVIISTDTVTAQRVVGL